MTGLMGQVRVDCETMSTKIDGNWDRPGDRPGEVGTVKEPVLSALNRFTPYLITVQIFYFHNHQTRKVQAI